MIKLRQDIVVAKVRGPEDHIMWALESDEFEVLTRHASLCLCTHTLTLRFLSFPFLVQEAMTLAEKHSDVLPAGRVEEIADKFLRHLLDDDDDAVGAAALLPRLLRGSQARWQQWFDEIMAMRVDAGNPW